MRASAFSASASAHPRGTGAYFGFNKTAIALYFKISIFAGRLEKLEFPVQNTECRD